MRICPEEQHTQLDVRDHLLTQQPPITWAGGQQGLVNALGALEVRFSGLGPSQRDLEICSLDGGLGGVALD